MQLINLSNIYNFTSLKFSWGNAGNQTWGCWVRASMRTSKQPHPPRELLRVQLPLKINLWNWQGVVSQQYSSHLRSKTLEVMGLIPTGCRAFFFSFYPSVVRLKSGPLRKWNATDSLSQKNRCLPVLLVAKQA